ncbi:plasmid mobilization protein [Demequina sp.]|uniref:plasmid mobilization protein n=1 Tax=Demequina sp. TaxID=2050685 RepID=UPI003A85AAF6
MRIDVRYTAAEREAIHRCSRAIGVKPSVWVRAAVLDALDARRGHMARMEAAESASIVPRPELARAVEQLRRVGVNLNQALRSGAALEDDLLREVASAVVEVRAQLGDGTST